MSKEQKREVEKTPEQIAPEGNLRENREADEGNLRENREADEAKRVANCQKEIKKVLEDNKCQLDSAVLLRAGQVIPQINIIAI